MNNLIKRSEEDQQKQSRALKHLLEDFLPVKDDVDKMRRCIELEPTADLAEDGIVVNEVLPER